jgi:hypothetical protein
MLLKLKIIFITTFRFLVFLAFTKKLDYGEILQKLQVTNWNCIKTSKDAEFAFLYISYLSRKLRLNNSCFVVSSLLFQCSPPGVKLHFARDSVQKATHSWFEFEGVCYTTDRGFNGITFESIIK